MFLILLNHSLYLDARIDSHLNRELNKTKNQAERHLPAASLTVVQCKSEKIYKFDAVF